MKALKVDVGSMKSKLPWCCEVAEEVEELCWAWGIASKDILGLTAARAHGLFLTLLVCLVSFASSFPLQTFFFQSYRVGPHRDHVEIPITSPAAQFPP